MSAPIRLGITGANGRMGGVLQALLREDASFQLAARIHASGAWHDAPKLDVVIDFSTPEGFAAALEHCVTHHVALVSGTTSLGARRFAAVGDAAREIPILHAANFSLGVAVLTRLVSEAAAALPDWDLEILETHHARKADAPSGTALALGRAAAEARGQDFDEVAVHARDGQTGPRPPGVIGFASLRAGEIVGEHTALLVGAGERLELIHRATDRTIFARGALAAAAWLAGQKTGHYSINDVLAAGVRR